MPGKQFVDTNILIYAHDLDAGKKQKSASNVIKSMWENGNGVLSTQVLQEFYVNVTKKISSPLASIEARDIMRNYFVWEIQTISPESIVDATEIEERHQISFWDAMIISSAKRAGATQLITEDLNHGQKIEGVQIWNPFLV